MKTTTAITRLFIIIQQLFSQKLLWLEASTSEAMSNRGHNERSEFCLRAAKPTPRSDWKPVPPT